MKWILAIVAVLAAGLYLAPDARAGDCRDVSAFRLGLADDYGGRLSLREELLLRQRARQRALLQSDLYGRPAFRSRLGFRDRFGFRSRSRFRSRDRFRSSRNLFFGLSLLR